MILPQTYLVALTVTILGMMCWGLWANTFKLAQWRFELYYFDFAIGMMLASLLLAFTAGSMGFDGFTFMDDLLHAGKRQWFYGFMGGVIFNFANMLLMGAISISGMGLAFPITMGLALTVGVITSFFARPTGSPYLIFGGCAIVLASILVGVIINKFMSDIRHEEEAKAGKAKSTRRPSGVKGAVVAIIAGVLMGFYYPLLGKATEGDLGLGPYSLCVLFATGVFLSTFIFNLFFMNLPLQGEPVEFSDYFGGRVAAHLMGLLGGALWLLGAAATFAAANSTSFQIGPPANVALIQGSAIVAAVCGIFVWHEYRQGDVRVQASLGLMLILYALGLGLISSAPLLMHRA